MIRNPDSIFFRSRARSGGPLFYIRSSSLSTPPRKYIDSQKVITFVGAASIQQAGLACHRPLFLRIALSFSAGEGKARLHTDERMGTGV